jgi:hypothetical protein
VLNATTRTGLLHCPSSRWRMSKCDAVCCGLNVPSVESGGNDGPSKLRLLAFDYLACRGLGRVVLHCVCVLVDGNSRRGQCCHANRSEPACGRS